MKIFLFSFSFSLQWEVNSFSRSCLNALCSWLILTFGMRVVVPVHTCKFKEYFGAFEKLFNMSWQYYENQTLVNRYDNEIMVIEIIKLDRTYFKQHPLLAPSWDCRTGDNLFFRTVYFCVIRYAQDKMYFSKTSRREISTAICRRL